MNTRILYDREAQSTHRVESQKPLRFTLNQGLEKYVPDMNIDVSSKLRQKSTNLNYYNKTETSLFGTAPFKGRGNTNIDAETKLIQGEYSKQCDRTLTEKSFSISNEYLKEMNVVDFRPESTTVNSKNACYKKNLLNR